MPTTVEQLDQCESIEELEDAFRAFNRRTAELRKTYEELKDEAEKMNDALREANQELERKVDELEELSSFQNSILSSLPVGVTVTDLDGTIERFNPAAEQIWGVKEEDAVGTHFEEIMGSGGSLLRGLLNGESSCRSDQQQLGDEALMVVSTTVNIVRDGNGEAIGAIQVDRDLTQVRRLEKKLSRCENLAELGRNAAGMAHEVRKPLNGIKGFASILRRMAEDEAADKYSSRIMEATNRLDALLEQLLDFAAPEDGDADVFDLREVTERVIEHVRAEAEGELAAVRITGQIPEGCRAVRGNADQIEQVILNLVKNGVEAIEQDGEVVVSARRVNADGGPGARVTVADTGSGIDEDEVEEIQKPFVTTKDGGSGLGLAMVNKFLGFHDTELDIDSGAAEETKMSFTLPLDQE